jgi:serine protease Do
MKDKTSKSTTIKKAPKNNNPNVLKSVLLVLVAVTAGFFGGYFGSQSNLSSNNSNSVTREIIEGEGNLINTIATDVSPSVVSVNVTSTSVQQDFFGFGREVESQSAGTGFIISEDGLILTNRHVVPETDAVISVVLSDGTELEAEVVGRTNQSDPLDIAFLKVNDAKGKELIPVT